MRKRTQKRVLLTLLGISALAFGVLSLSMGVNDAIGFLRHGLAQRSNGEVEVGSKSPDIMLSTIEGKRFRLKERVGERPLVLLFGSFTSPTFRNNAEHLGQIYERYSEDADFLTIYIKEAHPENEWQVTENVSEEILYAQPRVFEDRLAIARAFHERFSYSIPLGVDDMDNGAMVAFGAWPERIYIVEGNTVVYKGGIGHRDFRVAELLSWLQRRFE